MPATAIGTRLDEAARAPAGLDAVRSYWDAHVDDWKAASSPSGTLPFFEETEAYRFEKLDYLARVVDFDGYAGRRLLDLGCGIGNDTARFAPGGAEVTGSISLPAPSSSPVATSSCASCLVASR